MRKFPGRYESLVRSLLLLYIVQLHEPDNIEATQYGQLIFSVLKR